MRRATSPLAVYVVGYDPGLANAGAAVVQIGARPERDRLVDLVLWTTEKSAKKRNVLAADDNFSRAREMASMMIALHRHFDGTAGSGVRAVAAEAMSFPRNARTSAQIALFWGALACVCEREAYPMVQAGPQEIRRRLGLPTKAKKPEVHQRLASRFSNLGKKLDELHARRECVEMTDRQWAEAQLHPLDALAAIVAADESEVIRLIRRSLA